MLAAALWGDVCYLHVQVRKTGWFARGHMVVSAGARGSADSALGARVAWRARWWARDALRSEPGTEHAVDSCRSLLPRCLPGRLLPHPGFLRAVLASAAPPGLDSAHPRQCGLSFRVQRAGRFSFRFFPTVEASSSLRLRFPGCSDWRESAWRVGDLGSTLESGRSPGDGNGNCSLDSSVNSRACLAAVLGVANTLSFPL